MARFVKGDIVVVPFPFSQAAGSKPRPALVLASWPCMNSTDYLLCMISSQNVNDPYIMPLDNQHDLLNGTLNLQSYLRPTYMFAVGEARITRKLANLTPTKVEEVFAKIRAVFA